MPVRPAAQRPSLVLCFAILLAATVGYQWIYCFSTTNNDLTGLFFCGAQIPHPPELEHSGYHYQDSPGYDGQMYRLIAHDPFQTKGYWKYLDDPKLRGGRIFISLVAGIVGGHSVGGVDIAYVVLVDLFLIFGGIFFVLLTEGHCSRWTAIALYLAIPAVIASTDRMLLDGPSIAGFLAVLYLLRESKYRVLVAVLIVLPVIRETNLAIVAGIVLIYLLRGNFRVAVAAGAAALPGIAWLAYNGTHTPETTIVHQISFPLLPHIRRLFTAADLPLPPFANHAMQAIDVLSMGALLLTFGLIVVEAWRVWRDRRSGSLRAFPSSAAIVTIPSAIGLSFASGPEILVSPYGFLRVNSVLCTWAILHLLQRENRQNRAWIASYALVCSMGIGVYRVKPVLSFLANL
ncbi:MAG: hypothetical protein ABL967_14795 [Bryobacteraceae bacterium]